MPFILIGLWAINREQKGSFDFIMGYFCAGFFGLTIPIGIWSIFDRKPQLIINENGIWDRTLKQNEIKWEQITAAHILDIHSQKFISIAVDKTFEFSKPQNKFAKKLNEMIGLRRLNLNLSQIKINEKELLTLINSIRNCEKSEHLNYIREFALKQKLAITSIQSIY